MNVLSHRFVSPKGDGPDPTQVQPSNWNDGHVFTGGAPGAVLTRDPSDLTYGATWRRGLVELVASAAGRDLSAGPASLTYVSMPVLDVLDWIRCVIEVRVYGPAATPIALDLVGYGQSQAANVLLTLTGAAGAGDLVGYKTGIFDIGIALSPIDITLFTARATGTIVTGGVYEQARGFVFAQAPPVFGAADWQSQWALQFRQNTGVPAGTELLWRQSIYVIRGVTLATALQDGGTVAPLPAQE